MKDIRKTSMVIVIFVAIFSLSMGFLPQAVAQTSTFSTTLVAFCGISITEVVIVDNVTPPVAAVFQLNLNNTGNTVIPVDANAGRIIAAITTPVGGFASSTRDNANLVHIPPVQISVDGNDGGQSALLGAGSPYVVAATTLNDDGTDKLVAKLAPTTSGGENSPRLMKITAATDNMTNLPVFGLLSADFTLTGDVAGCFV